MPALDTTVKFFDSTMVGAPTLANVAGNLIAVLDACLVNGFGLKTCDSVVVTNGVAVATISTGHSAVAQSVIEIAGATPTGLNGQHKVISIGTTTVTFDAFGVADGAATGTITLKLAAAGWAKAFSGTNLAAYKSNNVQASGYHLRVDDSGTTVARAVAYMTMSDVSNGTFPMPTVGQLSGGAYIPKASSAVAKKWFVIASDRFCYIGIAPNAAYPAATFLLGFGDIVSKKPGDAHRFALFLHNADCSAVAPSDSYQGGIGSGGNCAKYVARAYSGLSYSTAISTAWFNTVAQSLSGYNGLLFPNPADNGVMFSTVYVNEGSVSRGSLPGIYASPQDIRQGISEGAVLEEAAPLNRKMMYRQLAYATAAWGGAFFDVTGPWNA